MTVLATEPPAAPMQVWACLQCVTEHKVAVVRETKPEDLPAVQAAITLAPTMTPAGACAVPTCAVHINVGGAPGLLLAQPGMQPSGR